MGSTIHLAGPLWSIGVQRCARCGAILTDYRGAMTPDGSAPLRGWAEGASIEVATGEPRYSCVTDAPPNCQLTERRPDFPRLTS